MSKANRFDAKAVIYQLLCSGITPKHIMDEVLSMSQDKRAAGNIGEFCLTEKEFKEVIILLGEMSQSLLSFISNDLAPILSEDFWDCECENHYIRPNTIERCPICNTSQEYMPSSRKGEVEAYFFPVLGDKEQSKGISFRDLEKYFSWCDEKGIDPSFEGAKAYCESILKQ